MFFSNYSLQYQLILLKPVKFCGINSAQFMPRIHKKVPRATLHKRPTLRGTLGPLLFLIYINDLVDDLSSHVKLFVDATSLFSAVYDVNASPHRNYIYISYTNNCTRCIQLMYTKCIQYVNKMYLTF